METLVKAAIVAIIVGISLVSFAVWNASADRPDVIKTDQNDKITVLASFYPLYDFTTIIGGDKINVELLIADGVEPHDWSPSIQDIENMQKADMVVINGLGWENWVDNFSEINTSTTIVDTSVNIPSSKIIISSAHKDHDDETEHDDDHDLHDETNETGHTEHDDDHDLHDETNETGHTEHDDDHDLHDETNETGHTEDDDHDLHDETNETGHTEDDDHDLHDETNETGHTEKEDDDHDLHDETNETGHDDEHDLHNDPHIWLNPNLVKIQVQTISNALQKLDPDNTAYYQSNTDLYLAKLDMLDNSIKNELSSCKNDFIAYHNAFSYFAAEYELNQHTIISSGDHHAEPTPKSFQNIIELAQDLDIDVIFTEEGIDQRTLDVLSQEINGRVLVLSPIEIGLENSSYLQRMDQNLSNLKVGLC